MGRWKRVDWQGTILPRARELVEAATYGVTLRHLFYLLLEDEQLAAVSDFSAKAHDIVPGKGYAYGDQLYRQLSQYSAVWRRDGLFPDLLDQKNFIHRPPAWDDPDDAQQWLRENYRIDRTIGQPVSLYLAIEKHTYVPLMEQWFEDLGIPILPLGGYTSQSFVKRIVFDAQTQRLQVPGGYVFRPAVLIDATDFDSDGEDIARDLETRTDCWKHVHRVALTHDQVRDLRLPPNPGKEGSPRKGGMVAKHGANLQVELEALRPAELLRDMFQAAIDQYWDDDAYQQALAREAEDRQQLEDHWDADGYRAARNTDQEEQ
jgi:hypothetical protein